MVAHNKAGQYEVDVERQTDQNVESFQPHILRIDHVALAYFLTPSDVFLIGYHKRSDLAFVIPL